MYNEVTEQGGSGGGVGTSKGSTLGGNSIRSSEGDRHCQQKWTAVEYISGHVRLPGVPLEYLTSHAPAHAVIQGDVTRVQIAGFLQPLEFS